MSLLKFTAARRTYGFDRGTGWYLVHRVDGHDLGEGPWDTKSDAEDFKDAEVGFPRVWKTARVTSTKQARVLARRARVLARE